jgi:hypothetical protein
MIRPLALHVIRGQAAKLVVHHRQERFDRAQIAFADIRQ